MYEVHNHHTHRPTHTHTHTYNHTYLPWHHHGLRYRIAAPYRGPAYMYVCMYVCVTCNFKNKNN